MPTPYRNPVHPASFADPFVFAVPPRDRGRTGARYVAVGTGAVVEGRVFQVLLSDDLVHWREAGGALEPLPPGAGTDYWAPEVAVGDDGRYFLYYSLGVGDAGHHLRVAVADAPAGPYRDAGVNLTPGERFAIDASPFRDVDGTWYLFYARDVLEGARVGTMLAVDVLEGMTALRGQPRTLLRPSGDWQVFRRGRQMYGQTYDWHTLEGPSVVRHGGRYWCFYSGGNWEEPSYGVSCAVADAPLGPWSEPSPEPLLRTVEGRVLGPGHCSLVEGPHGGLVMAYHAWDAARTARRMCLDPVLWTPAGPVVPGPSHEETWLERGASTGRLPRGD
jgi:GH43 family beta-xylosidase